jgi:hypothetical protein
MTHTAANVINDAFRAYDDDVSGGIASQTALFAVDTNWTQAVDTKFHVAMLATETAGGAANNYTYRLEYNLNSGGWADVTASTPIQSVAPTNCTTSDAASYGTTALTTGATIQATEYDTGGADSASVSLSSASFEYTTCLQIDSGQVADTDTIQLRLTNAGTALDADTTIPTITVSETGPQTASGTPQANITDAVGVATVTKKASGTPQANVTATVGVATVTKKASGTPQANAAATVGVATVVAEEVKYNAGAIPQNGFYYAGSVAVLAPEAGKNASGTPQANAAATVGVATVLKPASGTVQANLTDANGVATKTAKASGTPQANVAVTVGAAQRINEGSGTLQASAAVTVGVTTKTVKANGTPQAETATADGQAAVSGGGLQEASGTLEANPAVTVGVATKLVPASGTVQASAAVTVGAATRIQSGSGTLEANIANTTGAATRIHDATGSLEANVANTVGVGAKIVKATSTAQANAAVTAGVATKEVFANGAVEADTATADGAATASSPPLPDPLLGDYLNDLWVEYLDAQGVLGDTLPDQLLTAFRQENGTTGGTLDDNVTLYFSSLGITGPQSDQFTKFLDTYYPEYEGDLNNRLQQTLKSARFFL